MNDFEGSEMTESINTCFEKKGDNVNLDQRSSYSNKNGLNGMRVIATLFVVLFHFELSISIVENSRIFSGSYLFVEFFFILSGFLFAKGVVEGKHSNDIDSVS